MTTAALAQRRTRHARKEKGVAASARPGTGQTTPEREDAPASKRRIQMDFNPASYQRLVEIQKHIGESTITGVFRAALLILDWYLVRRHRGWHLQWVTPEGKFVDVPDLVLAASRKDPLPPQQA